MKKIKIAAIILILVLITGCATKANKVSENISKEADEFRVYRRIVFYNSIADVYILELKGFCSIEIDSDDKQLEVTCSIGNGLYQKHFLGLSDNVTYTVEQLDSSNVSPYKYEIIFKPKDIIPITIEIGD